MSLGPMAIVVMVVVGLIVAIALYSFAPVVGYQIASSTAIPANTPWYNITSANGNMAQATNATTLWSSTSGLPVIMIIAIVIGAAIGIFMGI